ncbi:MAG: type IX secretion system outer membrane channel protein PorV [Flavobacteriales bacterium]
MRKNQLFASLSAVSLILTYQAKAQIGTGQLTGNEVINTITTAVPLLLITPDARAAALGDAGGALSPDANSIHWGAAKLAFAEEDAAISLSYIPWLRNLVPDINLAYLSTYKKLKNGQAIGGSLRYFSLGNIVFTDIVGNVTGQFNPNEFAVDVAYSRKLTDRWGGGIALRYIFSNLTGGIDVQNTQTFPGQSVAADISAYYRNDELTLGDKKATYAFMTAFTNLGAKISYTQTAERNFIPMNLRVGNSLKLNLDDYNSFTFLFDMNKLLVPTPPVVDPQNNGAIIAGMDPNVSVVQGIIQSFYDAPGVLREDGTRNVLQEELREVILCGGVEYSYSDVFMVRTGYFHEHFTKGNRRYFTLGAGVKFNVFRLDLAYLIPTVQRHPLENTLRFTLAFDFAGFSQQQQKKANN